MHKLATHVIDTHGGLDRWQRHDALTAHLIQGAACTSAATLTTQGLCRTKCS